MLIHIDTREQKPFPFLDRRYIDTQTERVTLQVGDYSLCGLHDSIAIERKSLPDLITCLTHERGRFERELAKARDYDFFAVVIEAPFAALALGKYRSKMSPFAAVQSIASFETRYKIPFHFAYSRAFAEYTVWSLLRQYLKNNEHERALCKHEDEMQHGVR